VVEAFAEREAPRYLIRDRDASYGNEFRRRVQSLGMKEVITAPRSPWQNAIAERLIGSIRRECLDHGNVKDFAGLGVDVFNPWDEKIPR
jgi:transposase InsO family protein